MSVASLCTFQFLIVQLKDHAAPTVDYNLRFQFLIVQLKANTETRKSITFVSIPYSTIKSFFLSLLRNL